METYPFSLFFPEPGGGGAASGFVGGPGQWGEMANLPGGASVHCGSDLGSGLSLPRFGDPSRGPC